MKIKGAVVFAALAFVLVELAFFYFSPRHRDKSVRAILSPASWQHTVLPGALSQPHAFLESNCAACPCDSAPGRTVCCQKAGERIARTDLSR